MMTNAWVIILCFFRVALGTNNIISTAESQRKRERGLAERRVKSRSRSQFYTPQECIYIGNPKGLWAVIWDLPFLTI